MPRNFNDLHCFRQFLGNEAMLRMVLFVVSLLSSQLSYLAVAPPPEAKCKKVKPPQCLYRKGMLATMFELNTILKFHRLNGISSRYKVASSAISHRTWACFAALPLPPSILMDGPTGTRKLRESLLTVRVARHVCFWPAWPGTGQRLNARA